MSVIARTTIPARTFKRATRRSSSSRRLVLIGVAALLIMATIGCWMWSVAEGALPSNRMRATRWPAACSVPRRADVANVVCFAPADHESLELDLARLRSIVSDRLASATIVLGRPNNQQANSLTDVSRRSEAAPGIKFYFDRHQEARRDFGVQDQVEYLVYDFDNNLLGVCQSACQVAQILNRPGVAPRWSTESASLLGRNGQYNNTCPIPVRSE